MSRGTGAIAGPEMDVVESGAVSSSSLAVDLNLNLGPSFALELALGGQGGFKGSVPVSRQNWPRFEPSIPAGGQEDGTPSIAADPNANPAMAEDHRRSIIRIRAVGRIDEGIRIAEVGGINAGNDRNSVWVQEAVGVVGHGRGGGNRGELEGPLRGPLQASRPESLEPAASLASDHIDMPLSLLGPYSLRNPRHFWHPRRPRQAVFAPIPDLVEMQASPGHGSTAEGRAFGAKDSTPSVALSRSRNPRTPNTCLEIAPSHESNLWDGKRIQASSVGAHFECNICLETATEPVVTCCGHLFCWPCLYQWLHLHSSQEECPVCKGFLSDAVITPIYGRGTVQDTHKPEGNIPPRPHAHRINGRKRRRPDRSAQERPDGGVIAGAGRSEVQAERSEPEGSNAAELILNRLRVAQRLQREHLDERLRRLMGRLGGGFRSPSALSATAQGVVSPVQIPEQHHSEHLLTRMVVNRLETADRLAAIGASMDGLRENLEQHMQRTLEIVSSLSRQVGVSIPREGDNTRLSGLAGPSLDEERVPPPRIESHTPRHSTNGELQTDTLELPQRAWRRTANGASWFSDTEPGSLHARKRQHLN